MPPGESHVSHISKEYYVNYFNSSHRELGPPVLPFLSPARPYIPHVHLHVHPSPCTPAHPSIAPCTPLRPSITPCIPVHPSNAPCIPARPPHEFTSPTSTSMRSPYPPPCFNPSSFHIISRSTTDINKSHTYHLFYHTTLYHRHHHCTPDQCYVTPRHPHHPIHPSRPNAPKQSPHPHQNVDHNNLGAIRQ